jgi:glycine cleavage system aminomethyltransferase T
MSAGEPVAKRLSPFHHKQESLGAHFTIDNFEWARAEQFTHSAIEKNAAEQGVGFADLSHLTKLSLNGLGLKRLISERYNPSTADLRGRVLTGGRGPYESAWCAMLSLDEGMLVCNESLKEVIIKELTEGRAGNFTIVDASSVFAGCCLLGPKGRALIRKLTELNVNPEAFPNLRVTHTPIRHVPTILLRKDLGSILAYELYFERAYAEYVWDAIFNSGKELGITPAGSSAMKLLGMS